MTADLTTDQDTIVLLLRRIHFFDGLKFEDLERLSKLISILKVKSGEFIFRRGDPPEAFYILEHGRVEIFRETPTGPEIIATLGRSGDFFGEMALLEARPRSSFVRAVTSTELLMLSRPDFEVLMRDYPSIHLEVTKALSHNLRRSDTRFVDRLLEKNQQLARALGDLKSAQEELLKRERLSLIGDLAAGIIHDLKKPLTCISGYAQLLVKENLIQEKRQRYSDTIIHEVQRLVAMANEIRNFARGDHDVHPQRVNFGEWFDQIVPFLVSDLESGGVRFDHRLEYRGPLALDPEKFKNALYHLSAHALAAMPEGGTLTCTTERENGHLRLILADTGMGMDEEVCSRLFEEFLSSSRDGAGLGLAIVKRLIEAHGGTIEVESELKKGTRFIIRLPLETV